MKPRVATVKYLQPVPVSPHSVNDDRREHLSEHLDQRQWSVVGQADVTATLVGIVDEVNVPCTCADLTE